MAYRIISPRIGIPGDIWEPSDDTNINALLEHGFVENTGKSNTKSARTASETTVPDADENDEHQE